MKIDISKVLIDVLNLQPEHVATIIDQGIVSYQPTLADRPRILLTKDKILTVVPGSKVFIGGQTYVYFAPASPEDLEIYGVRKRTSGKSEKETVHVIPHDLTMENHEEKMGFRFKMTKEEKNRWSNRPLKEARTLAFKSRYNK